MYRDVIYILKYLGIPFVEQTTRTDPGYVLLINGCGILWYDNHVNWWFDGAESLLYEIETGLLYEPNI